MLAKVTDSMLDEAKENGDEIEYAILLLIRAIQHTSVKVTEDIPKEGGKK